MFNRRSLLLTSEWQRLTKLTNSHTHTLINYSLHHHGMDSCWGGGLVVMDERDGAVPSKNQALPGLCDIASCVSIAQEAARH